MSRNPDGFRLIGFSKWTKVVIFVDEEMFDGVSIGLECSLHKKMVLLS